jgi:hypothetical protein
LLTAFDLVSQTEESYRDAGNKRLLIELMLIKLVHLQTVLRLVEEEFDPLKKKVLTG